MEFRAKNGANIDLAGSESDISSAVEGLPFGARELPATLVPAAIRGSKDLQVHAFFAEVGPGFAKLSVLVRWINPADGRVRTVLESRVGSDLTYCLVLS